MLHHKLVCSLPKYNQAVNPSLVEFGYKIKFLKFISNGVQKSPQQTQREWLC